MVNLKEIGNRIQRCRKQQGYTQEQLADIMNVSIQMISNLERGNKAIRIDNLINLCQVLNVSSDYILTGKMAFHEFDALSARLSKLSAKDQKMIDMLINYCTPIETDYPQA